MLAPTHKWEADVELRPSENEDVELTPPTVVQEGVVELRHGWTQSFVLTGSR